MHAHVELVAGRRRPKQGKIRSSSLLESIALEQSVSSLPIQRVGAPQLCQAGKCQVPAMCLYLAARPVGANLAGGVKTAAGHGKKYIQLRTTKLPHFLLPPLFFPLLRPSEPDNTTASPPKPSTPPLSPSLFLPGCLPLLLFCLSLRPQFVSRGLLLVVIELAARTVAIA